MTHRPWILPFAALLTASLALIPACGKKAPESDPAPGPTPGPTPPPAVSSDYLLFAHLDAKAIRDSAVFNEIKQEFTKAGGTNEWNEVEVEATKGLGFKPTDLNTVTVVVTDIPPKGEPKFILILSAANAFDKTKTFRLGPKATPDSRGFYKQGREGLIHFPDDKTVVFLHPDLAQKYLDGFAKDRNAWPITADLKKAAEGHTAFLTVDMAKFPREELRGPVAKEFEPLLAAQKLVATADLKGKTLSVGARATFPDAAAAGKAKEMVQKYVGLAASEVEKVIKGKEASQLGAILPAVKEAHRALTEAKIEVSGSDLTLAAGYNANFDFGAFVADAIKKIRAAAARMKASNNLKQIGIALHTYHDLNQLLPIHGVAAKGVPLRNAKDKPLLSWRVAILPFIEQDALYKQFKLDEPWDSEHNKKLIEKMPKIFASETKPGKPGYTHLQMVIGPNAMQPGARLTSIVDGTSNTIAVIEAADPVIWTKPDDVILTGKEMANELKKKFGGQHEGGINTLFWDASVRFIRDSISDADLKAMLSPAGGEVISGNY